MRKKGTKKMFGKTYNNCVKKESFQSFNEKAQKCWDTHKKVGMKMKGGKLVNDCAQRMKRFKLRVQHGPKNLVKMNLED